jgi:Flp pilus assembly protein TadD
MSSQRLTALAAAVACLLTAGYFLRQNREEVKLRTANELGLQGRFADALDEARGIHRAPTVLRALVVEAQAAGLLGRVGVAVDALDQAIDRDPNNWILHRDRARALLRRGARDRARREMARALALNPRMELPRGFVRSG